MLFEVLVIVKPHRTLALVYTPDLSLYRCLYLWIVDDRVKPGPNRLPRGPWLLISSSDPPIHRLAFRVSSSTTLPYSGRIPTSSCYLFSVGLRLHGGHRHDTTRLRVPFLHDDDSRMKRTEFSRSSSSTYHESDHA